jgi:hypothetical protein
MKIPENNKPGTLSMFIAILQVIFIVSGCSAVQQTYGISETDLSWIKLGMQRSEIEAKLELEIVMEANDLFGNTVTYEFNRGYYPPAHDSPLWWPAAAVGWETLNLFSLGARSYWERKCQKSLLKLSYDTNNVLIEAREQLVDLNITRAGTRAICDRIRTHLIPSTLAIDSNIENEP